MKNKEAENVWRAAYAEKILKEVKAYEYAGAMLPQDSVLGVYLDTEVLHVRSWINGKIRPVISIPAYYVFDELDDILTGSRAVVHTKVRKDVSLHSVLAFMQEWTGTGNGVLENAGVKYCIALMKELKRNLEKNAYGAMQNCVLTISAPEIAVQKNVQTAMEQAGFHVLRVISVVEACALAKAYPMSEDQQILVRVLANNERQNLTADYTGDMLESLEYTFGEKLPDTTTSDMVQYCFSDAISRKDLGRESDQYEELAVAAADGAVCQGVKLTTILTESILLLTIFPWKVGIEIVTDQNEKVFPLTWISKEPKLIPTRGKESLSVSLNSGIQKKCLRLYLEADYSTKLIREWNLEEICQGFPKDTSQLEIQMEIDCEATSLTLAICAGEKVVKVGLNQYENEKINRIPMETTYVPETICRKIWHASQEFCQEAEKINADSAIGKGIQMIARQAEEVFAENVLANREIRVNALIEKMITVKDNIEYGLTGADKTTKREEYLDEKLLLTHFRKALRENLYRLNIESIEANGISFDPYIHEAMHIEETDVVEEDLVVGEIQKGYFFGDKLYRPAKVVVSKGKETKGM